MTTIRKSVSFRAQKDDTVEIRTESYLGREHIVVPVIALVEGVLQGMNAPEPELALTEEFGKVPDGWNGRPVVMNHPVVNGIPVSANSPGVLENYAFGMLFNTKVEDNKLKTEAWIDSARVAELGGEFESTMQRIQNGEVVEVSTGLFAGTEKSSGKFNGRSYNAIWRGIVPDHLAFLSDGVKGACSVEDGCGTPRVNADSGNWQEYKMATSGECGCGCGGTGGCGGGDHSHAPANDQEFAVQAVSRLTANAIPDSIFDNEVRTLLRAALSESLPAKQYSYVWGFSTNVVVYEVWDNKSDGYEMFSRTYDINADRVVTLGNEVTKVNLVTKVEPAPVKTKELFNKASEETTMADENATTTASEEVVDNAKGKTKMKDEGATPATPTDEPATDKGVKGNAAAATEAPRVRTMSEYLGEMPAEMREVFNSGLKLHNQKKADLVGQLKASGRCKFSDEQLAGMNLEMLENLAELANVPNYGGTATPRTNAAEDDAAPAAPVAFPRSAA